MRVQISHLLVMVTDGVPDSSGDSFAPDSTEFDSVKSVVLGPRDEPFGIIMGAAWLPLVGPRTHLYVTLSLSHAAFRLTDRTTPSIIGRTVKRTGNVINKAEVTGIMLAESRNADPRIRTVAEQMLTGVNVRERRSDGVWVALSRRDLGQGAACPVVVKPRPPGCECGAAKIGIKKGQTGHSSWCPWSKP